jgi:alkanesulfonate monooxygenase SsuD/methylene tetrahydromethanopterin reductase-like flavin-dependent oxidoreductase (luciferase family)
MLEEMGFWAFLVPDQYMWDAKDLGEDSEMGIDATLDSWIALSYLAAKTSSIRLGTFVTPLPLRPPQILAKMVSTLDNISEGRVVLGVGAGATERMFEAYSEWGDRLTRAKKSREALELMLHLWSDGKVTFQGEYFHCKDAVLEPKPMQKPNPLLLFGGAGKIMLRLAGEKGDICYIPPWTKLIYEAAKELVLSSARAVGRNKMPSFAYSFGGVLPPPYSNQTYLARVEEAVEKGCEYFMVPFRYHKAKPWSESGGDDLPDLLRTVKDFATNIMPSFSNK